MFPVAGTLAHVGYLLGDEALLDRAERWIDREPPPRMRSFIAYVGLCRAAHERRWADALELVEQVWIGNIDNAPAVGILSPLLVIAALIVGRPDLARDNVDQWAAVVAELGDQPRHTAFLSHGRVLLALAADEPCAGLGARPSDARRRGGRRLPDRADRRPRAARRHRGPSPTPRRGRPADGRGASRTRHHRLRRPSRRRPLADRRVWSNGSATTSPTPGTPGPHSAATTSSTTPAGHAGQRGRPTSGWDSLTPTEANVVALVADGLSNDEIAQRLLMGRATVKTHLTHIYTKTGTGNRAQLTAHYLRRPHVSHLTSGSVRWRDARPAPRPAGSLLVVIGRCLRRLDDVAGDGAGAGCGTCR